MNDLHSASATDIPALRRRLGPGFWAARTARIEGTFGGGNVSRRPEVTSAVGPIIDTARAICTGYWVRRPTPGSDTRTGSVALA